VFSNRATFPYQEVLPHFHDCHPNLPHPVNCDDPPDPPIAYYLAVPPSFFSFSVSALLPPGVPLLLKEAETSSSVFSRGKEFRSSFFLPADSSVISRKCLPSAISPTEFYVTSCFDHVPKKFWFLYCMAFCLPIASNRLSVTPLSFVPYRFPASFSLDFQRTTEVAQAPPSPWISFPRRSSARRVCVGPQCRHPNHPFRRVWPPERFLFFPSLIGNINLRTQPFFLSAAGIPSSLPFFAPVICFPKSPHPYHLYSCDQGSSLFLFFVSSSPSFRPVSDLFPSPPCSLSLAPAASLHRNYSSTFSGQVLRLGDL